MKAIRQGLIPEQMEDKWFIYWKDEQLFLHRSWTGHCIYVARFREESGGATLTEAEMNRDPDQYNSQEDSDEKATLLRLIDVLLLRKPASRRPEGKPEEVVLDWGSMGRAILGEHPERKKENG